jgi:hypothetical protein
MANYKVTLMIDSEEGDPKEWLWNDMIVGLQAEVLDWKSEQLCERCNKRPPRTSESKYCQKCRDWLKS